MTYLAKLFTIALCILTFSVGANAQAPAAKTKKPAAKKVSH